MSDEEKKDIVKFLKRMHSEETIRFNNHVEKLQSKGIADAFLSIEYTDGTAEAYRVYPEEQEEIVNFYLTLYTKRIKEYQRLIKQYEQ